VHRFAEEGWEPVVAAPSRRRLNLVMHDFKPGWDTYIERKGYGMSADIDFGQVNAADYTAVLILGGRAPEYLRNNATVLEIAREFDRQGKWIFAICHGMQILLAAGIGDIVKLTCYENVRFELESCGGTWVNRECVRDGKIITGQTWQSHPDFYRETIAALQE